MRGPRPAQSGCEQGGLQSICQCQDLHQERGGSQLPTHMSNLGWERVPLPFLPSSQSPGGDSGEIGPTLPAAPLNCILERDPHPVPLVSFGPAELPAIPGEVCAPRGLTQCPPRGSVSSLQGPPSLGWSLSAPCPTSQPCPVMGSVFTPRRPLGADRGDCPAARRAAEGPLCQAQGLRLQGGDAHHPLRVPAAELTALRAERE